MQNPEIYQKLTTTFRDVFEDDDLTLSDGTTAEQIDGWDSLNNIRLMLSVQKAFGMKFTAFEIGKLKNVGDLAALILSKMK